MPAPRPFQPPSNGLEPLEDVRRETESLIESGQVQLISTNGSNSEQLSLLGPITKEFFSKYATVRIPKPGITLDCGSVEQSEYQPGYLSIGSSEDWDIIQWEGADPIAIVEGSETSADEYEVVYATIYHLIVAEFENNQNTI